jgi:hypothetical protein
MNSYLIIGCGHFGSRAADQLLKKDPKSKIIIVDKKREAIERVSHLPIETAVSEGRDTLDQFLSEGRPVDFIIPAVPFHLAFEFVLARLKPYGARRGKVLPLPGLPNPILGKTGDLYTSIADFLCPEDCPEPSTSCTVTRKKRGKPLYSILGDLKGPFETRVIISQPLAVGVGGYRLKRLLESLEDIRKEKHRDHPILISTASRCHGVTSALIY